MKFRVWNDKDNKFEDPERYLIDSFGKLYYREPMDDSIEPAKPHLIYQPFDVVAGKSGFALFDGDFMD